jgi:hypothetical protein
MNKVSQTALLFLICCVSTCTVSGRICQALAIEAGGDKGAYEAGALDGLINNATNPLNVQWDVITGVSAGAINAGYISQFKIGDEKTMVQNLVSLWSQITSDNIYQSWDGGMVQGILFESSIFDESPVVPFLKKYITLPPQRPIRISATDANTGTYITFDENLTAEELGTVMRASSAVPVVFPYVNFRNYTFMDGGVINCLDIGSAVNACRAIADSDKDIYVDIILDDYTEALAPVNADDDSAFSILSRAFTILSYYSSLNLLIEAEAEFPDINFRYTVAPTQALPSFVIPLGFDHDQITQMIDIGRQDALDVLQKGPGVAHKEFMEKVRQTVKKLRKGSRRTAEAAMKQKIKEEAKKIYEQQLKDLEL